MPEFIKMAAHRHFKAEIRNSEIHVFDGIACCEILSYHCEIIFNE